MTHRWRPASTRHDVCARPGCTAHRRPRDSNGVNWEYRASTSADWSPRATPCAGGSLKAPLRRRERLTEP